MNDSLSQLTRDQLRRDRAAASFSLSQARAIVGDAYRPKPWIYWTDLLVCWSIGMAAYALVLRPEIGLPAQIGCFFVSSLLIYRCGLFIHELAHMPEHKFVAFRKVWNILCGVPFLIPSFVYQTHVDHHRRKHYGTAHDGEYLPLSNRSPWHIVLYLAQSFVIPILAVVRFGILTPLTWFNSPLRDWVLKHASSMIIDPAYLRPLPTAKAMEIVHRQERWTFGYIVIAAVLIYRGAFHEGLVSPWVLAQAYLTGVFVVMVNAVRTLGAHRWLGNEDEMTFVEQMLDSVNYPNPWSLGVIWAPVGLRFHALHHVFPTIPYHELPSAHQRLMQHLPADSPYRATVSQSLTSELSQLWQRASKSSEKQSHANGDPRQLSASA